MIPERILEAYVGRFPHLATLATNIRNGHWLAELRFAQNACRLEAPAGVSVREVWALAGVANGDGWDAAPLQPKPPTP